MAFKRFLFDVHAGENTLNVAHLDEHVRYTILHFTRVTVPAAAPQVKRRFENRSALYNFDAQQPYIVINISLKEINTD